MVLEEATTTPDSFSTDSAPSSDADPYYGDRSPTQLATRNPSYISVNSGNGTVHVNLDALPRPFTLVGKAPHPPNLSNVLTRMCGQAHQALGRPVTQEEADALAYHFTKSVRIASFGSPVGVVITTTLAFRGMSKFRFPGWTPGEKFNPDKFLMLKGSKARLAWQCTRYSVYVALGVGLGSLFFGSYALAVGSAGRALDPRLRTFMEALQQQAKNSGLPGNRQVDQTAGMREGETFDMARQRQRAQETWRNNQGRQQQSQDAKNNSGDDMSPTGGAFGADFVDFGSAAASDNAMMSDDQARQQSEGIQRQQEASYAKSQEPQQAPSQRRQEPARDAFSSQEDSKPAQSGSAWERLRQQAVSGKPPPPTTPRSPVSREAPSSRNGFTFPSSDEDRHLAKAEAQKDFDSRIERERSGKDFEEKRRW